MDLKQAKISVVIPVYNEAESLETLNLKIISIISSLTNNYEIIYIDDGSNDNSFEVLKKIKEDNSIKIIQFRRNFGKSAALSAGFKEASGDLIITMDADLQDDPSEIPNFIKKINKGCDLVSGWKKNRKDPLIKIISSKIFNFVVAKLTGIKIHDFNCGFKVYRKEVIKNIDVYGELHRFLPVLAHQKGFKISELIINHNKRQFGKSKYGKFGLRRLKNFFLDTINVFLLTKYAKKPSHFFGSLGFLSFTIGFLIGLYITYLRFTTGSIQSRFPLLMLGILLMVIGIQLISLGLLGEIIIRSSQKKDDTYNIKRKIL